MKPDYSKLTLEQLEKAIHEAFYKDSKPTGGVTETPVPGRPDMVQLNSAGMRIICSKKEWDDALKAETELWSSPALPSAEE